MRKQNKQICNKQIEKKKIFLTDKNSHKKKFMGAIFQGAIFLGRAIFRGDNFSRGGRGQGAIFQGAFFLEP